MRITTFLLFSFCLTQSINAQVNPEQERLIKESLPAIDSLFSRFAEDHHIPGIAYGLVVNGKLFHSGAYGYANLEKHIAADSFYVEKLYGHGCFTPARCRPDKTR